MKGKESNDSNRSNSLFNTFQYFSFSISKKTSGKETSAIAWFFSNPIGFYCARLVPCLVYFARVL